MLRTHNAGEISAELIGQTVTLSGWVARRRDHGGVAFLDLRDASGVAQVVVRDEEDFDPLRNEWVLKITGAVAKRPEGNENPSIASGEVEILVSELEVLNKAQALPFQVDEHVEVGEEARLKHRYLDLRLAGARPRAAAALRGEPGGLRVPARAELHRSRDPTLTRSTPEGARDFLVPARLAPDPGTPCPSRRSCSSSSSRSAVSRSTTRSPAATGTRTSEPIGSRSSPSWTSRPALSSRTTSSRWWRSLSVACGGSSARISTPRSPHHLPGSDAEVRNRQARPPIRP